MDTLLVLPALAIALTVHEAAHALTAYWLGDHLAKSQGRISLNPLRHLSLWGTLAIFVLGFGWGKPVPVNLYHFKHPKRDYLLCSLAGPLSNVLLAGLILVLLSLPLPELVKLLLLPSFIINGILAVFNLIPIPPLDGSKIWPCLIPGMRPTLGENLSRFGMIILIVTLYSGAIRKVTGPTVDWLYQTALVCMNDTRFYVERPADFPSDLWTPADACDISYVMTPTSKQTPPCYHINYHIKRPYPCNRFIADVQTHLQKQGWRPTQYRLYDPEDPNTQQWDKYHDEDWEMIDWIGYWIDANDRWLSLDITYFPDPNDPNSNKVAYVDMTLDGPGSEDIEDYLAYRQQHPQEFDFNEPPRISP